jgi:hypothetical protein
MQWNKPLDTKTFAMDDTRAVVGSARNERLCLQTWTVHSASKKRLAMADFWNSSMLIGDLSWQTDSVFVQAPSFPWRLKGNITIHRHRRQSWRSLIGRDVAPVCVCGAVSCTHRLFFGPVDRITKQLYVTGYEYCHLQDVTPCSPVQPASFRGRKTSQAGRPKQETREPFKPLKHKVYLNDI